LQNRPAAQLSTSQQKPSTQLPLSHSSASRHSPGCCVDDLIGPQAPRNAEAGKPSSRSQLRELQSFPQLQPSPSASSAEHPPAAPLTEHDCPAGQDETPQQTPSMQLPDSQSPASEQDAPFGPGTVEVSSTRQSISTASSRSPKGVATTTLESEHTSGNLEASRTLACQR
jgi:hypothetical protein